MGGSSFVGLFSISILLTMKISRQENYKSGIDFFTPLIPKHSVTSCKKTSYFS